jgi:hypothetical protein
MVEEEEEATKQEEVGLNLHKDTFNNPFNQGVLYICVINFGKVVLKWVKNTLLSLTNMVLLLLRR